MILLCSFLALSTLLLAVCMVYTARFFLKREGELVNRLLKQAGVQPVVIEREKVIKLPDPEIQPETWIDQAFHRDSVKEEIEQVYPEAARMSHSEVESRWPHEWRAIDRRLREQQAPIRAE